MEKDKRLLRRVACIHVTPYLAEYAVRRFPVDEKTGAIKIPDSSDLYHIVWNGMVKPTAGSREEGNLMIYLPKRREGKDPLYWNHITGKAVRSIDRTLRSYFFFEFHRYMLDATRQSTGTNILDLVYDFIHDRHLVTVSTDALIKNWQRYRMRISPHKKRKYTKKE